MVRMRGVLRGALPVAMMFALAGTATADTKGGAVAAGDDLSLIPVDSELVGGLDWQSLQSSALWQKYVSPLMQTSDFMKMSAEFQAKCGMDPMKAMTKISFGIKGVTGTPEGVIVMHGVDKAKLAPCIEKTANKDTTIKRDGDYWTATSAGKQATFTFINSSTMLAVFGPNGTKDGVKKAAAGGSSLKTSKTFVELYNKTNVNDTLWMLLNGNSKLFDGSNPLGLHPKAVYGSLNVGRDLSLEGRIRADSKDQASKVAGMLQSQTAQAAMFVDKLNIGNDGEDITISAMLSEAKLKMLMGMMGKGGGFGP